MKSGGLQGRHYLPHLQSLKEGAPGAAEGDSCPHGHRPLLDDSLPGRPLVLRNRSGHRPGTGTIHSYMDATRPLASPMLLVAADPQPEILPTSHHIAAESASTMAPGQQPRRTTNSGVRGSNNQCAPALCSERDPSIKPASGSSRLHDPDHHDDLSYPTVQSNRPYNIAW